MAKRVFCASSVPPVKTNKMNMIFQKMNDVLNTVLKNLSCKRIIVMCIISVCFLTCITTYFLCNVFDINGGGYSAESVALEYASLAINNDESMWQYTPRCVRNMKAATGIDVALPYLANDVVLTEPEIENCSDLNDTDFSELEEGFYHFYNKSVSISDAKFVSMSVNAKYHLSDGEHSDRLNFNIICIKINNKWYVYTGYSTYEIMAEL